MDDLRKTLGKQVVEEKARANEWVIIEFPVTRQGKVTKHESYVNVERENLKTNFNIFISKNAWKINESLENMQKIMKT